MSKMTINFECNGGAFYDQDESFDPTEVARILMMIAEAVRDGTTASRVYDFHGNKIGKFKLRIDKVECDEEREEHEDDE